MRRITTSVYSLEELSAESKEKAIEYVKYYMMPDFCDSWGLEYVDSLKQFASVFNIEVTDYSLGETNSNVSVNIPPSLEELKGKKLYACVQRKYDAYFKAYKTYYSANHKKRRKSRIKSYFNCEALTGMSTDHSLTQPIRDYLAHGPKTNFDSYTFVDLIEECTNSFIKDYEEDIYYYYSNENVIEYINVNDVEFYENGGVL